MNPGDVIGPYTLQRHIGSGGMADVYQAWDSANRWPVALKVLRAAPGKEAKLLKRSEREAALLMKLRNPHIVQIYGAGRAPDGRYYIAMEYIDGGDLDDLMRRKPGAKLPVAEAVYLARRVAGAMAYAHEAGVVHRDLKPANILLRGDSGEPVITDLGIAAFAGANPLTGTMESLGTPQYMAPEQAMGHGTADGRADIYAIGVILYELLTGRLPFEAENNWAILLRKQQEAAPPLLAARPNLDPQLAAVVDACLQRDPAARYQTAAALAAVLDALLPADAHPPLPVVVKSKGAVVKTPSNPVAVTPIPAPAGDEEERRKSPWLMGVGGAALLLLLAFFLFGRGGSGGGTEPTAAVIVGQQVNEGGTDNDGARLNSTAEPAQGATVAPTSTLLSPVVYTAATDEEIDEAVAAATKPFAPAPTRTRTITRTPTATEAPAATGTSTESPDRSSTLPPIVVVAPFIQGCFDDGGPPNFSTNDTILFRWNWPADPPSGSYLEMRVGPLGSATSIGRIDPATHRRGDEWSYEVSGSAIFRPGVGFYQWAVHLVDSDGRSLLSSPDNFCFDLAESVMDEEPTEEPSPVPDPDSDGDGVLDSQDQCPNEPMGDDPDPNRPGCPLSYP